MIDFAFALAIFFMCTAIGIGIITVYGTPYKYAVASLHQCSSHQRLNVQTLICNRKIRLIDFRESKPKVVNRPNFREIACGQLMTTVK